MPPHRRSGRHRSGRQPTARPGPGAPAALIATIIASVLVVSAGIGAFGMTAGPPPTPVPPSGSLSPYPQTLHTPPPSTQAPHPRAAAAILVNAKTGQVLFAKDAEAPRAIASLTKVMTALVTVRARTLSHIVTVSADAAAQTGSTLGLAAGERISVRSLLSALLLQSSNDAATALADDISGSSAAFVARMNVRARQLGLTGTRFASPNGLDDSGRSTAADLATLTRDALGSAELRSVMGAKYAVIANPAGPSRHIQNRNAMLWLYPGAFGVKTGYTSAAGECLITAASRKGRTLVSVVLGDDGDAVFDDSATLLNYGFDAFARSAVVRAGDPAGSVLIDGAHVDGVAGAALVRLVRSDRMGELRITLRARAGIALPVGAGQVIGLVVVTDHGQVVGSVPAVAAASVLAPPPSVTPGPAPTAPATGPLGVLLSLLRATFGSIL